MLRQNVRQLHIIVGYFNYNSVFWQRLGLEVQGCYTCMANTSWPYVKCWMLCAYINHWFLSLPLIWWRGGIISLEPLLMTWRIEDGGGLWRTWYTSSWKEETDFKRLFIPAGKKYQCVTKSVEHVHLEDETSKGWIGNRFRLMQIKTGTQGRLIFVDIRVSSCKLRTTNSCQPTNQLMSLSTSMSIALTEMRAIKARHCTVLMGITYETGAI